MRQINLQSNMRTAIRPSPSVEPPTVIWVCRQCTFQNPPGAVTCQTCGSVYTEDTPDEGDDSSEECENDLVGSNLLADPRTDNQKLNVPCEKSLMWLFDLYKTICTITGKFCSAMITGSPFSNDEIELTPWL